MSKHPTLMQAAILKLQAAQHVFDQCTLHDMYMSTCSVGLHTCKQDLKLIFAFTFVHVCIILFYFIYII